MKYLLAIRSYTAAELPTSNFFILNAHGGRKVANQAVILLLSRFAGGREIGNISTLETRGMIIRCLCIHIAWGINVEVSIAKSKICSPTSCNNPLAP